MTSSQPSASAAKTESRQEQCLLYLLGEMDASQSRDFERQLQGSPQLGDELLRQADLIAALASSPSSSTSSSPSTAAPLPVTAAERPSSPTLWLITIAASIALLVIGLRPGSGNGSRIASSGSAGSGVNEDLLIARAWADHQLNRKDDDFGLPEPDRDEAIWLADDDLRQNDTTFGWMFAAVSSGDAALAGETAITEAESDG